MCNKCVAVPAAFDTSYGGDPIATEPTVSDPAGIYTASKEVLALRVTAAELAKLLMTAKTDPVAIDMWDEGAALEFEGKYYTFGITPQQKSDMRAFVQYVSTPERATAEDMTDADVLPKAGVVVGSPEYQAIFDNQPTELEADIHESATVENTNKLIEDLEQQLDDAKADIIHTKNLVEEMDVRHNQAARVLIAQRDEARRKNLVFGKMLKHAGDALREQAEDVAYKNARIDDLTNYSRVIFNALLRSKKAQNELYTQGAFLNTKNNNLQATIDYLKRPFYQRWAISLRGRMMSATANGGK